MELNLTAEEVNMILSVLSEKPLRDVYAVFNKIQSQAKEQIESKEQNDTRV